MCLKLAHWAVASIFLITAIKWATLLEVERVNCEHKELIITHSYELMSETGTRKAEEINLRNSYS